ncbi:MAG: DUF4291 domain-containing protein [Anaerolineae bacterium]|jgi:hypothetical protein|nr:DUF4291 domain-containing protein [Anaerolineae bacterium]
MSRLITVPYLEQAPHYPASGSQVIAQYDDQTIVVYQAFNPLIAADAVREGRFGGPHYSLNRMSWIKPNFLWMMHRCEWAKGLPGQERVLAIWLDRVRFDQILIAAVPSHFQEDCYPDESAWKAALATSEVRVQWDPDYDAADVRQTRRAVQLGLRGETLRAFAQNGWITHLEDITDFVRTQAAYRARSHWDRLIVPQERVYSPH